MPKDKTGTTRIGDLAPQDMKKVCHLALIELTALYDVLGIELKQQKAVKIKTRGNHEMINHCIYFSNRKDGLDFLAVFLGDREKHLQNKPTLEDV